jgi:radical SAM/Cys-rich protein
MLAIINDFDRRIAETAEGDLRNVNLDVIQVNVGLKCNQACVHCHVKSSPQRTEMMDWPTMELILSAAKRVNSRLVDITGGAPELNPHLPRFITALREQGLRVQVRTNLTVLLEPGMETMAQFFHDNRVQLVASLPCYLEENVDKQRGRGVFDGSIEALKILNSLGYGRDPELQLDLVYNPIGPYLPPDQASLEVAYRQQLQERFGIQFTRLITITNMPIGRFLSDLHRQGKDERYWKLLSESFNAETVDKLMCKHQIEIDWDGTIYDCDFNLAIKMPVDHGAPKNIRDFDPASLIGRKIATGDHCFGCTAGRGSSCGGALT